MKNLGTITFTPVNGGNLVEFIMPVQLIAQVDGTFRLKLPLLGNMETMAKNESDIDTALSELSDCFMQAAGKFGKGVHEELQALGWSGTKRSVRFKLRDRDRRPEFNKVFRSAGSTTQKTFSVQL